VVDVGIGGGWLNVRLLVLVVLVVLVMNVVIVAIDWLLLIFVL